MKKENNLTLHDRMYLILILSVIFGSFKCILNINLSTYGTYFLPLIIYSITNYEQSKISHNTILNFPKGILSFPEDIAPVVNNTYKYIIENTHKEDKILILPDGAMLNFQTDRFSNNKYFHLAPPETETLGKENIAKDLEYNLPEYLIVISIPFPDYAETHFCSGFGDTICKLIPKYYEKPIIYGSGFDFWIEIYKKKTKI